MPPKQTHIDKLHTFFSGNVLKEKHEQILTGYPVIVVTPNDEPWALTVDEVEAILHEYYPDLSAVVYDRRIVVFHEAEKTPTDSPSKGERPLLGGRGGLCGSRKRENLGI